MKKDLGTFSKFHVESITKSDKDPNWNPPIREISVRKKGPSLKVTYQPFQIVKFSLLGIGGLTPLHLACINPKSTKALNEIYAACPDLQLTDDQGMYVGLFT